MTAQAIKLLTIVLKISVSFLSGYLDYSDCVSWLSSVFPCRSHEGVLNYTMTTYFHCIIYYHLIIRLYKDFVTPVLF
jgi:hypothetical protein